MIKKIVVSAIIVASFVIMVFQGANYKRASDLNDYHRKIVTEQEYLIFLVNKRYSIERLEEKFGVARRPIEGGHALHIAPMLVLQQGDFDNRKYGKPRKDFGGYIMHFSEEGVLMGFGLAH